MTNLEGSTNTGFDSEEELKAYVRETNINVLKAQIKSLQDKGHEEELSPEDRNKLNNLKKVLSDLPMQ
ncbi:MAG: hypothetical protein AAB693_02240 [Patescibacteria group bacterium]